MLQNNSFNLHSICQNTMWTLINCPLRSIALDILGENRPKPFPHWKVCLFFEKFCFQQLLWCYRIIPVTSTVVVKIPCGPSEIVPWGLSHSIIREKIEQKLFSLESLPFFKKLCFQQPRRCNRIIPLTSKIFVDIASGYSKFGPWGLSHSRKREKTGQKLFFTGKFAFSFKNLCFQQPRRCYRINAVTSKVIVKILC